LFAQNSALFRLSPVLFVGQADERNWVMPKNPANASGSTSPLLGRAVSNSTYVASVSSESHEAVFAGGGAGAECGAVSPATKNEQMMTEDKDLQIQDRPATESASKSRDDGTHELKHAGDTWPPVAKLLDFSDRSEFLVATGVSKILEIDASVAR
jgi:hypothetical protein